MDTHADNPIQRAILISKQQKKTGAHLQELIGLHFCLFFETNMRPRCEASSSFCQLKKGIPGTAGKLSLLIRASELAQPGKTGEYDTSVSLDLAHYQFLFPVLRVLKATRGERQLLLSFSYTQPDQNMEDALKQLRCQQLQITPYTLRHGGASEDRAARSLEEV